MKADKKVHLLFENMLCFTLLFPVLLDKISFKTGPPLQQQKFS